MGMYRLAPRRDMPPRCAQYCHSRRRNHVFGIINPDNMIAQSAKLPSQISRSTTQIEDALIAFWWNERHEALPVGGDE